MYYIYSQPFEFVLSFRNATHVVVCNFCFHVKRYLKFLIRMLICLTSSVPKALSHSMKVKTFPGWSFKLLVMKLTPYA